jgi:murein L,D-transpeptidase YcbB/YkuD
VAATIEHLLSSAEHPWLHWSAIPDVAPVLTKLYEAKPDRLFWFAGETPYPVVEGALEALASAGEHGLDPAAYDGDRLKDEWAAVQTDSVPAPERALFDLALSVNVARLLSAGHIGRIDPAALHWGYDVDPKRIDLAATLETVRKGEGVEAILAELEPQFPHYSRLRRALADYKALAEAGEPELVPELPAKSPKVELGDAWEGVRALAARLAAFGDLSADQAAAYVGSASNETPVYDQTLVDAVKRFQWRHGLEEDGVLGKGTLGALNVPVADRVRQIELALERERWLPAMREDSTVFVNVALFRLWATDPATGEEPLRMNVVVGKSLHHRTPIFIEQMEYAVLRPYWNVPYSIAARETVPRTRKDSSCLDAHDFEIVAGGSDDARALPPTPENLDKIVAGKLRVRQRPGPGNALGLAKFIFPNANNVYMHGTPAQQLFSRARRDFSHGCIRLEDPAQFAEWVLRDQPEWTREKIDAAMKGERPNRVNLTEPLRVVLFYVTTHVDSEGVVHFADDIYGHDAVLDAALARGYPYPTSDDGKG